MNKRNVINELCDKIADKLPSDAHILKDDFKKQIHQTVESSLKKLNVVTQEEFDAQKQVLEKTQAKLDELQKQIDELEKQLDGNSNDKDN